MSHQQKGFTLIEIAIVLVIVGLLLGGVLKGQELITQARIKNVANDFNNIATAIYGYQDRYRRLPGDDETASGRWNGTKPGNHDGSIAGNFNSKTDEDESRLAWRHLRQSGFLNGDPASLEQPGHAAGGIIGLQNNAGKTTTGGKDSIDLAGTVICASNLNGKTAGALDTQFDDGRANAGSVRGYLQSAAVSADGATSPTDASSALSYSEDGQTFYTVCRTL